ncbi:peptidoglycan D,D-transpeptidase FtsI family protein [Nocardia huaxiensis]|uniref:Penicillin-binding protein 2 n=1 Tax=Nocardia huaxiensis TaxID=2755382 RepID=A0A7D6VCH7_9NOCA|nr:penicillin-binding protein 2 [Nocardia huaxiensis]QLY31082.1 penicillin-binding protein 2 [Nocardia huaxiensis]UFS94608.1 penicillin-binding protein 2 [Nocardia huaxiensis]
MNTPLRRVSLAVMVMIVALLANATYVQWWKADDLRTDTRNRRVLLDEYARQRGQISAQGVVLASSVATEDRYKYLRIYPTDPRAYAHVTGYYTMQNGRDGLENAEDSILSGSDNDLFGRRLVDMISGRDPRGGNVITTLNPAMQKVAYDQLTSKGYTGSVVAIEPSTGRILTMVSTPSYDPNELTVHDGAQVTEKKTELQQDDGQPLINRAVSMIYPPGSTFKVVVTAAALANGLATPSDQLTAASRITLPDTNTTLENYNGSHCGPGDGATASLTEAFKYSCNTAFVDLGIKVGAAKLKDEAAAFGIGDHSGIPLEWGTSTVGDIPDKAALGQSSIGQRDVSITPLDNAVIAATIANGGVRMQPHLVDQLQAPDLTTLKNINAMSVGQAVSAQVASQITAMMIESEKNTQGGTQPRSYTIASKTGTAEHGDDPRNTPPHAWYIAFAPAQNPKIAIAVIVENGGDRALAATGGSVAAPVARAVLDAGLQGG